jgi:hypothetical protein
MSFRDGWWENFDLSETGFGDVAKTISDRIKWAFNSAQMQEHSRRLFNYYTMPTPSRKKKGNP